MTAFVIALGSNVGDRQLWLRRAVHELQQSVRVTRVSSVYDTAPVGAPPGSANFLNAVVVGHTDRSPEQLVQLCLGAERRLGRRRGLRNAPRNIDIDVILHGASLRRTRDVMVPHPRFTEREFVLAPLRELALGFHEPRSGVAIDAMSAPGDATLTTPMFG